MRKLLLFLLLSSVAFSAAAQKLEWRLGAEGFFDNGRAMILTVPQ